MIKKHLVALSAFVVMFLFTAMPAMAQEVSLNFNQKALQGDVSPVIQSGRTLVPLKAICDALGSDIGWDGKTGTITIKKGPKVIKLTLNKKEVYVNDQRVPDLEVPAKSINGRTMVPVRFISENLGATVTWDSQTKAVNIVYNETKDGRSAQELYVKSTEAMKDIKSYKFSGSGTTNTTVMGQTTKGEMTIEGAFKAPEEMYLKEVVKSTSNYVQLEIPIEMYMKNSKEMYSKTMDQDWQKIDMELPDSLNSGSEQQDPTKVLEQLNEFGLIFSYGDEVTVDGKGYYVLHVRIDQEKYKNKLIEVIDDMKLPAQPENSGVTIDEAQLKEELKKMYQDMKMDMSYKIYIDKETYYMTKMEIGSYMVIKTSTLPADATVSLDMAMDLTGFGAEVTMPVIAAAK